MGVTFNSSTIMDIGYNGSNVNFTTITIDTTTSTDVIITPFTSDIVMWYFRLIVYGILGQIVAIMGSITNIINIIIFLKLGVRNDAMNVSLLGLSVSDFVSCFSVIFLNLCLTPGFTENENLPFTPVGTHLLFSAWPHAIFVKITILITAFITIERCLCVTYPLKIKQIFTPKRVAIITISIYLFLFALTSPIYHIFRMEWVFFPERNRTLYTIVFHEDRPTIEPPLFTLFSLVIPFVSFTAIILSTLILVANLKKNAKWRSSVTASTTKSDVKDQAPDSDTTSSKPQVLPRDAKVAKMVVVISTLYIVCNLPVSFSIVALLTVDELKEGGAYQNTLYVLFSFNYLLESINASLNIFIYYSMSTNYKTMVQSILHKSPKTRS